MGQHLNVAIAAGGTAGHINPALALAEELRERGHQVSFYGQEAKLEGRLVPEAGFELVPMQVSGFDRDRPWTGVTALVKEAAAKRAISARFKAQGAPDVAIGFGAYVETPLLGACVSAGVPTMIHEQNSVPGLANKMAAKRVARACVALPAAVPVFEGLVRPGVAVTVTGNPVRTAVLAGSRERGRALLGVPADAELLVVFGGSLGARHVNEAVAALKDALLRRENLYVVHSTGADLYDETLELLKLSDAEKQRWQLRPYIDAMGDVLAAADLVLSRAGASSIAEISALAVPSVLVPYPHARGDHQTANANSLVEPGAALLVTDASLDEGALEHALLPLVDSAQRRAQMRAAAQGLGSAQASQRLADELEQVARG